MSALADNQSNVRVQRVAGAQAFMCIKNLIFYTHGAQYV